MVLPTREATMTGQIYGGAGWRELRQARGLTQQDVADALCRLAQVHEKRGVGVNADMVSKWERGEKKPSAIYRRLLGLLFDTAPAPGPSKLLEPSTGLDASMVGALEQRLTGFDPLLRPALVEMWKDDIVKRRSMLQLMGALPMGGIDVLAETILVRGSESDVVATPSTVHRLTELARDYQRLYHAAEPTELITPVRAFLHTARRLLSTSMDPELRRQLLCAYGQVGLLAGRVSFFDLHDASAARGFFAGVMDAARELEDRILAAAALGHMSFVPTEERNFDAACEYVRRTRQYAARDEASMVASWASAIESEIWTQANEPGAAVEAVERAGLDAGQATAPLPKWFDFYDQGRLEGFRGYAMLQAGRLDEARLALENGVSRLPADAVKQRSVLLVDLAAAHLHLADLEQACEIASAALTELSRAGYATGASRMRQFRRDVEPWRQHRAVRQLDEQLAAG
jgi:transcriptional regulator with XRE-family HTH domain